MFHLQSYKAIAAPLAMMLSLILLAGSPISARQWSDTTGKFSAEAELVTHDADYVVLETVEGEMIGIRRDQLSEEDQQYVSGLEKEQSAGDRTKATSAPDSDQQQVQEERDHSAWTLSGGESARGRLLGFGNQTFTVRRQLGDLLVNGEPVRQLSPTFAKVLLDVVSQVDGVQFDDLEDLEAHVAEGGGGPFEYQVEGVQLEQPSGRTVTVPLTLLASEDAEALQAGFKRWEAARDVGVSNGDRSAVDSRERLMLDAYQRSRRTPRARPRPVELMELKLLAASAGVIDIWVVRIYPPTPYGYPRSVAVPAQNSLIAQRMAAQAYPGWRIGATRKLNE